jgi:hypothetical protein
MSDFKFSIAVMKVSTFKLITNLIRMVYILFLPFVELFFPLFKLKVKSLLSCR